MVKQNGHFVVYFSGKLKVQLCARSLARLARYDARYVCALCPLDCLLALPS